jgi:DNA-binding NarL/FixJ family response regulator
MAAATSLEATRIKVLIVEDLQMISEMMVRVLRDESDITVVGTAATVSDSYRLLNEERADVVLMDYNLPDGDGISAAAEIRKRHPLTKVVIITGSVGEQLLRDALDAGCAGYLLKTEHVANIPLAIRAAHAGSTAVSPETLARVMRSSKQKARPDELSERELEVLELIARGHTADEIAEKLFLSQHTVRNHIQAVLEKLDVHSKLEAVMAAHRLGLIKIGQ